MVAGLVARGVGIAIKGIGKALRGFGFKGTK